MAKKITQETFDEVIKENVDDFEMPVADAIKDAVKQFIKQGVNLDNIDISGGIGRDEILAAIDKLIATGVDEENQLLAILSQIAVLCGKTHDHDKRNRNLMNERGGVNKLHNIVGASKSREVLLESLELITDLSLNSLEIRDFFEPGGSVKVISVLKETLTRTSIEFDEGDVKLIVAALTLCRVVSKSENNKVMLMKAGAGEVINDILSRFDRDVTLPSSIVLEACKLIREQCIHDDLRRDMSCAYDNGKFFLKQDNVVKGLLKLSADFKQNSTIASVALLAARNLITTEEAVQVMTQHGAMELPNAIFSHVDASLSLVRSALGLMRNLCADDRRKDRLVSDGTLQQMLSIVTAEKYASDPILMEHALACLAAMSLRSPTNSQRIVAYGAIDLIVRSMHRHNTNPAHQRQGCLAIRNIAARASTEMKNALLDAGVEPVLRTAGTLPYVTDEAYAALRDLNCAVQYVTITTEGKAIPAFEQFGANSNKNFNPVYDDTCDIVGRVAEEARAPFRVDKSGQMSTLYEEDEDEEALHATAASVSAGASGHDHAHDHVHDGDCNHVLDKMEKMACCDHHK